MEEKANNKKKKLLTVALVFTVVLAVTATTWCIYPFIQPKEFSPDATFKLPAKPKPITCTENTGHFDSGCKLLLRYDADKDGKISDGEYYQALDDWKAGKITEKEGDFVGWTNGCKGINEHCPGCYSP